MNEQQRLFQSMYASNQPLRTTGTKIRQSKLLREHGYTKQFDSKVSYASQNFNW